MGELFLMFLFAGATGGYTYAMVRNYADYGKGYTKGAMHVEPYVNTAVYRIEKTDCGQYINFTIYKNLEKRGE